MSGNNPKLAPRAAYDASQRFQTVITGPSMTHQSMMAECDINRIMAKWQKTGVLEHRNTHEGNYGDFTDVPQNYHEAMEQILAAEEMFSSLPSTVRKKFGNDPGNFLEFVSDKENAAEMVELGLAEVRQDTPDQVIENLGKTISKMEKKMADPSPKSEKPKDEKPSKDG